MFPGKRKKPQLHLAIPFDVSGSVSDAEIEQFFSEINYMYKQGVKLTVIQADCEVRSVEEYDPKKPIQRNGQGGTEYSPALKKAEELVLKVLL